MGIHKVTRGERRRDGCSPVGFPHGCMYVGERAESMILRRRESRTTYAPGSSKSSLHLVLVQAVVSLALSGQAGTGFLAAWCRLRLISDEDEMR